jgi:hypothetical protein
MRRAATALLLLLCAPALAVGQADTPDHRGEVWGGLVDPVTGTKAQVQIPLELRQRNSVGTNGAGLCVIASQVTDGRKQERPAEVQGLWDTAKRRWGGYSPPKLKSLVAEVCPELPYLSYEGADTDGLERLTRQGIPIGVTYSTGKLYGYRHIAHMVSLIHLDSARAAVIDNNKPEVVAWMPRAEFDRRFRDRGEGWAFLWQLASARLGPVSLDGLLVAVVVGGGVAILYLALRRRHESRAAA